MLDQFTLQRCKQDREVLQLKIRSLEHAIQELEAIISESILDDNELIFMRRKIANSRQDLEVLYVLKN